MRGIEYKGLQRIAGPVLMAARNAAVGFNEAVAVYDKEGGRRLGRVVGLDEQRCAIQIFGNAAGLSGESSRVEYLGKPMEMRVGPGLLGRVFNGLGDPIDGYGDIISSVFQDVNGLPINPYARINPRDVIQTGISAIDGLNTLVRGQILPIFSMNGLPHHKLAAQIIRQARIFDPRKESRGSASQPFVVVFCAIGLKSEAARFFLEDFQRSQILSNLVAFLSLADAPSLEWLAAPRCALTAAEYLAYQQNMQVLVVMTDMTNYGEALREAATFRGESPGRNDYPDYLYSDLASLYERAGTIASSTGSITLIPILSMPRDDIGHPIPDLSGYSAEGQLILDRELFREEVYPPIAPLPSQSRQMQNSIGAGMTREDHAAIANQFFASYSRAKSLRNRISMGAEETLSARDTPYLDFGRMVEQSFINQGETENRSIEETLDLLWSMLRTLPREDLTRIDQASLESYYDDKVPAFLGHYPEIH